MNKSVDFSHIPPWTSEEHPQSYEVISLKTRTVWRASLLTAPHSATGAWELHNTEEKELQSLGVVSAVSDPLKASWIVTQSIMPNDHLHCAIL